MKQRSKHAKLPRCTCEWDGCTENLNDEENENKALAKALSNFETCYLNTYIESDKEPMILFYLAELSRRFQKRDDATKWFSTLVSKYKNSTSFYVKAGKERWQELREK